MNRRPHFSILVSFAIIIALAGCASFLSVEARIEGRVLLEGVDNGQLGGSLVVLDGKKTTHTDPNGYFAFEGKISGGDEYEILVSHEGFYSMGGTGTLKYDIEVEMNVTSVGNITLESINREMAQCAK